MILSAQQLTSAHFSSKTPDTQEKKTSCLRPLALVAQTFMDMSNKAAKQSIHVSDHSEAVVVTVEWTTFRTEKTDFFHAFETEFYIHSIILIIPTGLDG